MTPSRTALLLIASLTYTACDSPSSADDDEPHGGIDDPGIAQGGNADTHGYEDRGYESTCILRVANGSDLATLDDDAGLWGASAEAIIAAKRGPDGEPSTADDVQFATLTELDAVDWVGFLDFAAIVDRSEDDENPVLAFLSWNPFDTELTKIRLLIASVTTPIINPLSTTYWSQSPYRLGGDTVAVKYRARPCPGAALGPELDDADPEYFTASMQQQLAAGTACFEFAIQRQRDPATMPIEDNSVEWREAESAFVPVATLEIAAQDFASDANREACEHLSFTPWHALPEHRPLGSLNRARRRAYEAISKRRHDLNGVPRQEP